VRGLRSTIVLAVILAGLAAYIFFVDADRPVGDTAGPPAVDVAADDIAEITITAADGSVSTLHRDGDAWRLVAPVEAAADASVVSTVASSLASLAVERTISDTPTDLQEYGLDPPGIEVAFRTSGGETHRLQIGATTPAGDNRYARLVDEGGVFLVGSFLQSTFDRTPFALRDKRVLVFDAAATSTFSVDTGGTTRRFARRDGTWTIEAPITARGDHAKIDAMLSSVSSGRMQAVVDEAPADLAPYGLDAPTATLTAVAGDSTATLELGATADGAVYAKDAARPMVFTVPASLAEGLERPLSELRSVDLFDVRPATAERLEIARDGGTMVLERATNDAGEQVWRTGDGTVIDDEAATTALDALVALRVGVFLDERHAALASPGLTVTATFDGDRTETVSFARDGDDVFASRSGEPGSVRLELTTRYESALTALDALNAPPVS